MGHVTIDMVSFPNTDDKDAHPFFWAIDISCELTDNAAVTLFFDILMEGQLNQQTGEYAISYKKPGDEDFVEESERSDGQSASEDGGGIKREKGLIIEPRQFMFCHFLNHSGLAQIQYKTFFHMCRLESISFDMESRTGSTFCLYDCLASGVIGMLTIGIHRRATVKFMMDALNFIQNQAGAMPKKVYDRNFDKQQDYLSVFDVISRVKLIYRASEKNKGDNALDGPPEQTKT